MVDKAEDDNNRRFRTRSLQRLARLETTWVAVVGSGGIKPEAAAGLRHDVDKLLEEAAAAGLTAVQAICRSMSDLLAFARERDYSVAQDIDHLMMMAIQLLGQLIRDEIGAKRIDAKGFIRQVHEAILFGNKTPTDRPVRTRAPAIGRATSIPRRRGSLAPAAFKSHCVPAAVFCQLAINATNVYLEQLRLAVGPSQTRLRESWRALAQGISAIEAVPLSSLLPSHVVFGLELARARGYPMGFALTAADVRISSTVAEVVDIVLACVIEAAVDERRGGTLRLNVSRDGDSVSITVADDLDLAASDAQEKRRSLRLPGDPRTGLVSGWTRFASQLDAAATTLSSVGGTVTLQSLPVGSAVVMRVPEAKRTVAVRHFRASWGQVEIAITADWSVAVEPALPENRLGARDLYGECLGVSRPQGTSRPGTVLRLRRGTLDFRVLAGGPPTDATAEQMCSTGPDHHVEVVAIAGNEALLVRPERLSP
jgi:hypothetical protein